MILYGPDFTCWECGVPYDKAPPVEETAVCKEPGCGHQIGPCCRKEAKCVCCWGPLCYAHVAQYDEDYECRWCDSCWADQQFRDAHDGLSADQYLDVQVALIEHALGGEPP